MQRDPYMFRPSRPQGSARSSRLDRAFCLGLRRRAGEVGCRLVDPGLMMRIVGAVLVALAALSITLAPAVAKPKPHRKSAVTAAARAGYAAMPETERSAIQSDLVWTGDYNGIVGVDASDASIVAIKTFQKRSGGKDTGILDPDQRQ